MASIVAARLEQLATPGKIYVSGKVVKEVEGKLPFGFAPIGERKMKNLADPVMVCRVNARQPPLPLRHPVERRVLLERRTLTIAAAVLFVAALSAGAITRAGSFQIAIPSKRNNT